MVADGAMGTMLYAKGVFVNRCFDELCLSQPSLVEEVHRAYLAAGAQLIETNTFGANRSRLLAHGLETRADEINRAAVDLARRSIESSGRGAFIGGSVGPLGGPLHRSESLSPREMEEIYGEQIVALAEAGADCIVIETISHIEEMRCAIRASRAACDLPVVAQMTFTEDGTTLFGDRPEEVAPLLRAEGADVVGVNCGIGPQPMLDVLEKMRAAGDFPLSVQPNAGSPQRVEGRYIYFCSPEYMAAYARRFIRRGGARLVGGCCGTTPEHIRAVATAVKSLQPARVSFSSAAAAPSARPLVEPIPFRERSALARRIADGRFVASVEINPPRGTSVAAVLEAARAIQAAGVDAVNVPDGPRASARMSSLALGAILARDVEIEVLLHYCCRDRNLLGMQSDLLGAHAHGLRNLILITGDPPKLGDYPSATAVYDVDSIGLTRIVDRMNHGHDLAGNAIGPPTSFLIGVGVDPGSERPDEEVRRLREKIDAGAEVVFTQPVFEETRLRDFLDRCEGIDLPFIVGILPLVSSRNAEFYHNEVPGMSIPAAVRDRMRKAGSGAAAQREGVEIARAALASVIRHRQIRGAYVMPPLGRTAVALEVLEGFLAPPE